MVTPADRCKTDVVSGQDLIGEYLDSLPPDERRAQARQFEESALLRLMVDRVMESGPEVQKVLMAEFELYNETGEVEEGSLFADLLKDAEAVEYREAVARSPTAGGRSPLLRFLARAGYEASLRDLEEGFALIDPLEQAFVKLLFDFYAQVGLLAEEGADAFVDRIAEHGPQAMPVPDRRGKVPPESIVAIAVLGAIHRVKGEMVGETLYAAARHHRDFADDARRLRDPFPWGWWSESARAFSTAS